jgi:hypothetical protein
MRNSLAGWLGVALLMALPAAAWADIPPPPPVGLEQSPGLRPLPIIIGGAATALAIGLGGAFLARSRSGVLLPFLGSAVIILAIAGLFAWRADQAWAKHDSLEAEYNKTRANWRPLGPVDRGGILRKTWQARRAVSVMSFAPQDSFPNNISWAALAVNANTPSPDRPIPRPQTGDTLR